MKISIDAIRMPQSPTFKRYMNDVRGYTTMSPEEEFTAFCQLRNGDNSIKEKIVNANQRFVVTIAKQYCNEETIMDGINEGNLGLIESVDLFDHTKGFKFITYAIHRIKLRIRNFVVNTTQTIKPNTSSHVNKLKQISERFFLENGYDIGHNDLIDKLGVSRFYDLNNISKNNMMDINETTFNYVSNKVNDDIETSHNTYIISELLKGLSNRDIQIITLTYGLDGCRPHSTTEIGEVMGISYERVRQLKARIISKMKYKYKKKLAI